MKFSFSIVDAPGKMPVGEMRPLFESSVMQTERLRKVADLSYVEKDGLFLHYRDPETDTLWNGFALGLRSAERIEKAKTP